MIVVIPVLRACRCGHAPIVARERFLRERSGRYAVGNSEKIVQNVVTDRSVILDSIPPAVNRLPSAHEPVTVAPGDL